MLLKSLFSRATTVDCRISLNNGEQSLEIASYHQIILSDQLFYILGRSDNIWYICDSEHQAIRKQEVAQRTSTPRKITKEEMILFEEFNNTS